MTTTVVKERQGSHVLILHSISLKSPPPSSGEIGCESSGEINMKPAPRANTLAGYLDQLADSEKHRARMREKALEGTVQELTRLLKRDEEFLDSNRMSLVDQCLRVIKKGRAAEELSMAARAIGLVAMILDDMENVHEIYRDAVPKLFEAVKSSSSKFKPPAPAQDSPHHQGKKKEHSAELVAAAISSWCFILSSDKYGISRTHWLTAIPCFFHLLGHDNESVVLAAAEVLALIFEIDSLMSTPTSAAVDDNGAHGESSSSTSSHPSKQNIVQKLNERMLVMNTVDDEQGNKLENAKVTRLAFVAKFFEDGSSCKTLETTRKQGMTLTTWSERLQLAFLEGFLGEDTFAEHMKVNEQLQSMFNMKVVKKVSAEKPMTMAYDVEREEVKFQFYKPKLKWMLNEGGSVYFDEHKERLIHKKLSKSPTSWWSKARTQHMKKQRQVAATDRGKNILISPDYD